MIDDIVKGFNPNLFVLTNVTTGKTKYARISAVNNIGSSLQSNFVKGIPSGVPQAPVGLSSECSMYIYELQMINIEQRSETKFNLCRRLPPRFSKLKKLFREAVPAET